MISNEINKKTIVMLCNALKINIWTIDFLA